MTYGYDGADATALAHLVAKGEVTPDGTAGSGPRGDGGAEPRAERRRAGAGRCRAPSDRRRAAARAVPGGAVPASRILAARRWISPRTTARACWRTPPIDRDSAIFQRMRATGVVTFGRTTSPEGGIGAATESAVYGGPTRNPWNLDHTSGGSSGGAGAAVAAGIVPFAHGSDGGGSVRIPASSCGLFGFKPTRARLPDGPYRGRGLGGHGDRRVPHLVGARHGGDAGCLRGGRPRRALLGAAAGTRPRRSDHPPAAPAARGAVRDDLHRRADPSGVPQGGAWRGAPAGGSRPSCRTRAAAGRCHAHDARLDRHRRASARRLACARRWPRWGAP